MFDYMRTDWGPLTGTLGKRSNIAALLTMLSRARREFPNASRPVFPKSITSGSEKVSQTMLDAEDLWPPSRRIWEEAWGAGL
ncbi:MAG: hypothetical protein CM15mP74_00070 [Halieaceae bacterium]|nr:MAG: hypothetical protein CM15mP74_00070 [Halieaceae bacterium]